jgi:hypothetical protein
VKLINKWRKISLRKKISFLATLGVVLLLGGIFIWFNYFYPPKANIITPQAHINPDTVWKVAAILYNFSDDQSQPFTPEQARQDIFTGNPSVNGFITEASFGKKRLEGRLRPDGDIFGWVTLPFSKADACNYDRGFYALQAVGVNKADYDNIYYLPNYYCSTGQVNYRMSVPTAIHEFGHKFGFNESNSISSCSNSQGYKVPVGNLCVIDGYGDVYDVMGYGFNAPRHYNNVFKAFAGWIEPSKVQTVTQSGTFTLYAQEVASTGIQLIRIPLNHVINTAAKSTPTQPISGMDIKYYYLEFRKSYGYDDLALSEWSVLKAGAYDGILIRGASDYTIPADQWNNMSYPNGLFQAGYKGSWPLKVDEIFYDPNNKISIKTKSFSQDAATVEINLNPPTCLNNIPEVTVSPSVGLAVQPGVYYPYTVSIKNNNSNCGASNFHIATNVPSGWTAPTPKDIKLGPGATDVVFIDAAAPVGTNAGSYPISFTITNNSDTEKKVIARVDFLVDSPKQLSSVSKLVIITPPQTITVNNPSSYIIILTQDANGNIVNVSTQSGWPGVYLLSSPSGGEFSEKSYLWQTAYVAFSNKSYFVSYFKSPTPGTYTLTFKNTDSSSTWTPAAQQITVVPDTTQAYTRTYSSLGWNMISFPDTANKPLADVLPEEYWSYLFRYDKNSNNYIRGTDPNFGNLNWYSGYWLYIKTPLTITYAALPMQGTLTQDLATPGWHMIGTGKNEQSLLGTNPNFKVRDKTTGESKSFEDAWRSGWINNPLFYYDPERLTYDSAGADFIDATSKTLPWQGYWILTKKANLELLVGQ